MRSVPSPKKLLTQDFLPYLILSTIFLAGAIFWVLFAIGEKERLQDYFHFSAERISDQLVRAQMMSRFEPEFLPQNILGFGIYDDEGIALQTWGQVPRRLSQFPTALNHEPPQAPLSHPRAERSLIIEQPQNTYDFIKSLTPPWLAGHSQRFGMRMPPRMFGEPDLSREHYVFLRLFNPHYRATQDGWSAALVLGPLLWAALLTWIGWLWIRTRRYERDLVKTREVLSFAEAARTLSHEIRNPLSAILLQTALLDRNQEEVRIIEEETRRISRLVERVRDFLGDPRGRPEPQNAWQTLALLRERFAQPFRLEPEQDPGWFVAFDEVRFRSVLENLLKNAYESGPEPAVQARVTQPRPGQLRVEIIDNGLGLSTDPNRLFTPFYTTKIQGSGIGLAVSRRFVEAAGGRLKLTNRHNASGALAEVELPLILGNSSPRPADSL
ncbi:MAG: hypothetical protein HKM05_05790 [Spirochaetales bacterium]|nr:hypothetical protein [Spirochaetales bacterium]